jgi:hemerythrin superfamily protein
MDDGYAQLERDHRELEAQLAKLLRDDDAPVVREVAEHLTRHSQAEDEALYPALRRWVDGGDDLADRAQQEHASIATMVAELYDSVTPERLADLVTQLRDAVAAHIAFEESEIFPELRDLGVEVAWPGDQPRSDDRKAS